MPKNVILILWDLIEEYAEAKSLKDHAEDTGHNVEAKSSDYNKAREELREFLGMPKEKK